MPLSAEDPHFDLGPTFGRCASASPPRARNCRVRIPRGQPRGSDQLTRVKSSAPSPDHPRLLGGKTERPGTDLDVGVRGNGDHALHGRRDSELNEAVAGIEVQLVVDMEYSALPIGIAEQQGDESIGADTRAGLRVNLGRQPRLIRKRDYHLRHAHSRARTFLLDRATAELGLRLCPALSSGPVRYGRGGASSYR